MDLTNDFKISFGQLLRHKIIVIPSFLSLLIPLLLFSIFFYSSGVRPVMLDLAHLMTEYDEKQAAMIAQSDFSGKQDVANLMNYLFQGDEYKKGFAVYAGERGFDWGRFRILLTTQNIFLMIFFSVFGVISSFYFSCVSYALITLILRRQEFTFSNIVKLTNGFFFSFSSLELLIIFIILAPAIVALLLLILSFIYIKSLIVIAPAFLLVAFIVLWLIFASLRLVFSTPILFFERKKVFGSVKMSYEITKHHLKQIFVIAIIIYGMGVFSSSIIGQPLSGLSIRILLNENVAPLIVNVVILMIFLFLESCIFAFENLFFFASYLDFRGVILL